MARDPLVGTTVAGYLLLDRVGNSIAVNIAVADIALCIPIEIALILVLSGRTVVARVRNSVAIRIWPPLLPAASLIGTLGDDGGSLHPVRRWPQGARRSGKSGQRPGITLRRGS